MNTHSFIKGENSLSSLNIKKAEKQMAACSNPNQMGKIRNSPSAAQVSGSMSQGERSLPEKG
jgi:hypothetical protein